MESTRVVVKVADDKDPALPKAIKSNPGSRLFGNALQTIKRGGSDALRPTARLVPKVGEPTQRRAQIAITTERALKRGTGCMRSDSAEKEQPKRSRVEECTRNALNITVDRKQKGETRKMIERLYQDDKDPGVPVMRVERLPKLDLVVNRKGQLSQVPVVRIEDNRSKQADRNAKPPLRNVVPSAHFIKRSVVAAPKLRSRNALGFDERKPEPTREERIEQSRQMQMIEAQRLTEKEEMRRDQKEELRRKKAKSQRTDSVPEKRRKDESSTRKEPEERRKEERRKDERRKEERRKEPVERRKEPEERRKEPEERRKEPEERRKEERRKDPEERRKNPEERRKDPEERRKEPEARPEVEAQGKEVKAQRRKTTAPKVEQEVVHEAETDPHTPRVAPTKKYGPEREVLQQRIGNWMLKMGVQEGHLGLLTQLAIASVEAHGFDKRAELVKEIQPYLADKTNVLVDLLAKFTKLVDGILHPICESATASADAHAAELFLNRKQLSDQKRRLLRQCTLNMQEVMSKLGNPDVEEAKKSQYRAMIPKIKEKMEQLSQDLLKQS